MPDPTRGGGDQASQGPGDAVLVPGAVLGEGFQGLPGGGLLQGQDRLGDGMFLDVERHGGDPLGEAVEAAAGEGPSEGLQQGLPDGPGEFSLGHDASPVSGQLGLSPPAKFRPGDATFQYGTPAQLLWSFSWKLLDNTESAWLSENPVCFHPSSPNSSARQGGTSSAREVGRIGNPSYCHPAHRSSKERCSLKGAIF